VRASPSALVIPDRHARRGCVRSTGLKCLRASAGFALSGRPHDPGASVPGSGGLGGGRWRRVGAPGGFVRGTGFRRPRRLGGC
jgi:hypothetical protein